MSFTDPEFQTTKTESHEQCSKDQVLRMNSYCPKTIVSSYTSKYENCSIRKLNKNKKLCGKTVENNISIKDYIYKKDWIFSLPN